MRALDHPRPRPVSSLSLCPCLASTIRYDNAGVLDCVGAHTWSQFFRWDKSDPLSPPPRPPSAKQRRARWRRRLREEEVQVGADERRRQEV